MKKALLPLLIFMLILPASCIFGPTSKRVMSYRRNNVYLSGRDHFRVGELPGTWKRMRVRAYTIAFHNPDLKATIATDAFCGPAYEDLPLNLLTSHLLAGVEDYKIEDTKEFMLDDRGALRTVASGRVDGVPLMFDIVVVKKNKCIVDFMCIAPEDGYTMAATDFDLFYSGFHYE